MNNEQCIRALSEKLERLEIRLQWLLPNRITELTEAECEYAITKAALIVLCEQRLICNDNEL